MMATMEQPYDLAVSVVVATKNRPELLRHCVELLCAQLGAIEGGAEVVVVDDGDGSATAVARLDPRVRVIRGRGEGPGRARNRGIAAARGQVVCFTDDDATPAADWLARIVAYLADHPEAVGVRGRVRSIDFDPLYEHSVSDGTGGGYLTCNVAYRHEVLDAVGGFDPAFRFAHEDRDLGYRAGALGPVGFDPSIEVEHPPRPFTFAEWARRGRFVTDDWLLYARYPAQARGSGPKRFRPVEQIARRWLHFAADPAVRGEGARRGFRIAALAAGQLSVALWTALSTDRRSIEAMAPPSAVLSRRLKVAYIGPVPNPSAGGAPGVAGLIFQYLVAQGVELTCYLPISAESDDASAISTLDSVTIHGVQSPFRFGRWYSSHRLSKMASAQVATARGRAKAARALLADHQSEPFDVLWQFSTIELFGLGRHRATLPPIASMPSVHAAGELRWLRSERRLAERGEGRIRAAAVRAWVAARAVRQAKDLQLASSVLAISATFGRHLVADYGIDPSRVTVVPNAIDLERFRPAEGPRVAGPLRIVVLGRITVRKGLEDVVALSHALGDLAGEVVLHVVGDHSLWSDYRSVLEDLNPDVATYLGHRPHGEVAELLRSADLLVQVSHYEPFGLTVAEALASGVPVLVTDEVGAAEGLPALAAHQVDVGDVDAMDRAVREELAWVRTADAAAWETRRAALRQLAEQRYSRWHVGRLAHDALRGCATRGVEEVTPPR